MSDERFPGIPRGLSPRQERVKRAFDLAVAVPGFVLTLPVVVPAVLAATASTGEWGVFSQERIGLGGKPFRVHKIRSMRSSTAHSTTVTTTSDPRITRVGAFLRRSKIDELPQLWNVVKGEMSLVGPRPDVAGWADATEGPDRVILSIRPGITGPASLAFRDEEKTLAGVKDPESYNLNTVWPEKVRLNREYAQSWSLGHDIRLIVSTIVS